jgi:hypothetical protein
MCAILLALDELHGFETSVLNVDISEEAARDDPRRYYKAVFASILNRYQLVSRPDMGVARATTFKHTHIVSAASRVFQTHSQDEELTRRLKAWELAALLYRPDMLERYT